MSQMRMRGLVMLVGYCLLVLCGAQLVGAVLIQYQGADKGFAPSNLREEEVNEMSH